MKLILVLALCFVPAFAGDVADKAFKLFKDDVRKYVAETNDTDARYREIAIRSAKPTVSSAIRNECAKKRCKDKQCRHERMASYVDNAMQKR